MDRRRDKEKDRVCSLAELKQVRDWEKHLVEFKPYYETLLSENLGAHCREWPARKANAEVRMLVKANSKPHDIVIYADDSVSRGRSGSSRVEGLNTKTVEPTESQPPA